MKINLKLVVCLLTVLVFSVGLNYVLVSNLERQIMSQPPSQPSFLNVKITPRDVKLHVNETQVFTATVNDGTAPYSYTWKRDMNITLGYEQNISFSFSVATPYAMLSVDVVDSRNRVGYDFVKVEDPYSSSNVYLNTFGMPYRYLIEADGLGWYRAINGSNGAIDYSGTSVATVTKSSLDAMIASSTYFGTLHFAKGAYLFTTEVLMERTLSAGLKEGLIVEGEGRYATVLAAIGAHSVFKFHGYSRDDRFESFTFRSLEITSDATTRSAGDHGLVFINATFVNIYDCFIVGCYDSGIYMEGLEGNFIHECGIYGNKGNGVEIVNACDTFITSNSIDFNELNGISVIYAVTMSIEHNLISYSGQCGIFLYWGTKDSTVGDNKIAVNGRDGIFLAADCDNDTISDNVIYENSVTTTNTYNGIRITDSSNNVLIGNRIFDETGVAPCQKWGILEDGTSDYNTIIGCNTRGGSTGGIFKTGTNTHVNLCWNNTVWIP